MIESHYAEMPQPLGIFANELQKRGIEYLDAFEFLTKGQDGKLLFASYFLFAHSIELFLKAFLAARGTTKAHIRGLRHNLPRIMRECERSQIPKVDILPEFVAHIFEMNKDFDFRYPSGYHLSMPRPIECIKIARALAAAIKPIVDGAAIRAQIYFASETGKYRGKKIRWSD